jgi:putative hemolysin
MRNPAYLKENFLQSLTLLKPSAWQKKAAAVPRAQGVLQKLTDVSGLEFIDQALELFNVSYYFSQFSRRNIPANGRTIIIADHPLDTLEALMLIRLVGEIRSDVRLVSTGLLNDWPQLRNHVIRFDISGFAAARNSMRLLLDALQRGQAVILFPPAKAVRFVPGQNPENRWHRRLLRLALTAQAALLPVRLQSKGLQKPFLAPSRQDIHVHVGEPVPHGSLQGSQQGGQTLQTRCRQVRRHLVLVGKGKSGVLRTEKTIIHPQHPQALRLELKQSPLLGETADGHKIYVFDYRDDSAVMREIGRLREYSFRAVGEGTGQRKDVDRYDRYYQHIVLWNEAELEIVGAYRVAEAGTVLQAHGAGGLYCSELFEFGDELLAKLPQAMELGRSFVQPHYWGRRSLDYLWYGVGAYISRYPHIKYVYGPVSISNIYPEPAKQAIVGFYSSYFGGREQARARKPFSLSAARAIPFSGADYEADFARLKEYLAYFDAKVPALYKQYTELCEQGGARFLGFNIDPDFAFCVDGLVWIELDKIKPKKRARYLTAKESMQS